MTLPPLVPLGSNGIDHLLPLRRREERVQLIERIAIDRSGGVRRALLGTQARGKALRVDRGLFDLLRQYREHLRVGLPHRHVRGTALLDEPLDRRALLRRECVSFRAAPSNPPRWARSSFGAAACEGASCAKAYAPGMTVIAATSSAPVATLWTLRFMVLDLRSE